MIIRNGLPFPDQLEVRNAAFVTFGDALTVITHFDRISGEDMKAIKGDLIVAARRAPSGLVWFALEYKGITLDAPVFTSSEEARRMLGDWVNTMHIVSTEGTVHYVRHQRLIGLPHDFAGLIKSASEYRKPYVQLLQDIEDYQSQNTPRATIDNADVVHKSSG